MAGKVSLRHTARMRVDESYRLGANLQAQLPGGRVTEELEVIFDEALCLMALAQSFFYSVLYKQNQRVSRTRAHP